MPNYTDDFIMSPKVDFVFKELMSNAMVCKGFLGAVLNIPDTEIETTAINPMYNEKDILYILLTLNSGNKIDVEIHLSHSKSDADKSLFYLLNMLVEQVGDKRCGNIRKCIGINILDFRYKDTNRFHTIYHIGENREHFTFTDVIELHIIELPKLPENTDGTSLYDWAKFINTEDREGFQMLAKKSVYLDEAYKQLEVISQDQEKQLEYTARQKAPYDYNTMMEARFNAGVEQGTELELKKKGFTDEHIADLLK